MGHEPLEAVIEYVRGEAEHLRAHEFVQALLGEGVFPVGASCRVEHVFVHFVRAVSRGQVRHHHYCNALLRELFHEPRANEIGGDAPELLVLHTEHLSFV